MNLYGFDLVKEAVKKARRESDMDWLEIKDNFAFDQSAESLRKYSVAWKLLEDWNLVNFETVEQSKKLATENRYKETTEIKQDGTHASDKLVAMSEEDSKDVNFLLKAHGFDSGAWELLSAKNNIWNVSNGDLANKTLYSSKITVKPIANGVNFEELINNAVKANVKKSELIYKKDNRAENMLVIPYFDLHFGIATLETYKNLLNKTLSKIKSKKWDKVLIIFGQDSLHNDGFTGQTTSGTVIDKVDMEKAWADLHFFYTNIFNESIINANSVDAIFSNGNHDQSMGWAFGKLLEYQYPQVKFDSEMKQFKGYKWKNIFIGATHGDRGSNRIFEVYLAEYGKLIASSTTKEILSGHVHHQKTIDKYGLVHKTLGTGVPTDNYHADNGFVGAQKQFQLLEYNSDYPEAVYYM